MSSQNQDNTMALLRNFRALVLPKSPTRIYVKLLFSYLYAFLDLCRLFGWKFRTFIEVFSSPEKRQQQQSKTRRIPTHKVFGVFRQIDIPKDEFPSEVEVQRLEALMPSCCQHGWLQSATGYQLHYRRFLPDTKNPKAIVVWMHGLQGFGGEAQMLSNGRKTNMALQAEAYLKEGFAVYAMDMVGHGFSEGRRYYMPNGREMLADYINFVKLVSSSHDVNIPLFLSGYSYGSLLTLKAARYYQNNPLDAPTNFLGILLQAPAIYDLEGLFLFPLVTGFLKKFLLPILGPEFVPPRFFPNRIHPRRFWRCMERYDLGMVQNGLNCAGKVIPLQSALTVVEDAISTRMDVIPGLEVPFCVTHGRRDKIVRSAGSEFLMRASSTAKEDQSAQYFADAYHDLLGEVEAEAVMKFQIDWIQERLKLSASY